MMMADLVEEAVPADARNRNISAKVSPAPKAPILRKLRRVTPSQNRCFSPQMVNMAGPPFKQPGRRKVNPRRVTQGGYPGGAFDGKPSSPVLQSKFFRLPSLSNQEQRVLRFVPTFAASVDFFPRSSYTSAAMLRIGSCRGTCMSAVRWLFL